MVKKAGLAKSKKAKVGFQCCKVGKDACAVGDTAIETSFDGPGALAAFFV